MAKFNSYIHHIILYSSDYAVPIAWVEVINETPVMTADDFKQFLIDNNYTSQKNAYCLGGGGCAWWYEVRTTSSEVVKIACPHSGFYVSNNTIIQKFNFSATAEVEDLSRLKIETKKITNKQYYKKLLALLIDEIC